MAHSFSTLYIIIHNGNDNKTVVMVKAVIKKYDVLYIFFILFYWKKK